MASDIWKVTHRPRLNCPECKRPVALTKRGTYWPHIDYRLGYKYCKAVGRPALLHQLDEAWPCPHCGGTKTHVESFGDEMAMECDRCRARGPVVKMLPPPGENYPPALHAWNVREP